MAMFTTHFWMTLGLCNGRARPRSLSHYNATHLILDYEIFYLLNLTINAFVRVPPASMFEWRTHSTFSQPHCDLYSPGKPLTLGCKIMSLAGVRISLSDECSTIIHDMSQQSQSISLPRIVLLSMILYWYLSLMYHIIGVSFLFNLKARIRLMLPMFASPDIIAND